jgi:hypothetical protein
MRFLSVATRMQKARFSVPSQSSVSPRFTTCFWVTTLALHSCTEV